jgi:tRNA(fMet)-specific endonuclease VapC
VIRVYLKIGRLDDDELAIAPVSVAEYRVGIELADTASRAGERDAASL